MRDQLIDIITKRLDESKEQLKAQFSQQHAIKVARHFALDNLLPNDLANEIYANFPNPKKMRLLNNYGELKMRCSHIKNTTPLLQSLHHAIQDPNVIAIIEYITGIKDQIPDKSRIAGGISSMLKGNYINPHLDNSHDIDKKYYRTVNLLYYVSPNWQLENGGNYELWDTAVENRIIVPSLFNRLVVMETNQTSWHAVNPVVSDAPRCCVFNYYFSERSPQGEDYFHGASSIFFNPLFKARPEHKFRRTLARYKQAIFG
jgi:Rps23 Pro-64 3,4-dihydroxylase Tpa1-like proline 4-hydroxylase